MILCKWPSRSRGPSAKGDGPKFLDTLKPWVSSATDLEQIHFLFSFDTDDRTMDGIDEQLDALGIQYTMIVGNSTSKIHAINRDINELRIAWDILLVLSDDMHCKVQGWDKLIRDDMDLYYPDGDGCLWRYDCHQRAICTMPLMGRTWYERFGYVYHPSYTSVFADDEQTAVAQAEGKMMFFPEPICEHVHPANVGPKVNDRLYQKNETTAIWNKDQATYHRRKALGFPK